jgi:hypothetical protein
MDIKMSSNNVSPSAVFQQYVSYLADGRVDTGKAMKAFEDDFRKYIKAQGAIKPAITDELKTYGRLGEGKLISYTLHHLKLPPTGENVERVKTALAEMATTGIIVYNTSENGNRRGRNTGWQIAAHPVQQ